ncbi:MAG: threonine/serine dehydratase [Anaerovoracaceae bacterium]|nr:threonine/serine dehydratase [Anaerovoracaceae bacterium]
MDVVDKSALNVDLKTVQDAEKRIRPYVRKTPVMQIDLPGGEPVILKLENLQNTNAFKIRGASNFLLQMTDEQKKNGVTTGSSGNHAQGVALAAKLLEIKCIVCMPEIAPKAKVEATRAHGAEVELIPGLYTQACDTAHRHEREEGMIYVPAFDDEKIIAGQGTIALEILDQVPECGRIITAIGGGGMISGIAAAARGLRPDIQIIGVEAENAACMYASWKAKKLVAIDPKASVADGTVSDIVSPRTLEYCEAYVDEIVTVNEEEVKKAVLYNLEHGRIVAEGAGSLPLAALLAGKVPASVKGDTVCVVSGGNIDSKLLAQIIEELR